MDDSNIDNWLSASRNKYMSIRNASEVCEIPDQSMEKQILAILLKMKNDILLHETQNPDISAHLAIVSALVEYELGKLYYWKHDEEAAETCFKVAWRFVEEHLMDTDLFLLAICILNELHAIAIHKDNTSDVNHYADLNLKLRRDYDYEIDRVMSLDNLFLKKSARDKIRTSTEITSRAHNQHKVVKQSYSHSLAVNLLRTANHFLEEDLHNIWFSTILRFATMLTNSRRFYSARYIIACANVLMISDDESLKRHRSKETDDEIEFAKAYVDNYWCRYAMHLLNYSWNMKVTGQTDDIIPAFEMALRQQHDQNFPFFSESKVVELESRIICKMAADREEALDILSFGENHAEKALVYYRDEQHVSEHMSLIGVVDNLYRHACCFNNDEATLWETYERAVRTMMSKLNDFDMTYPQFDQKMLFSLTYWQIRMLVFKEKALLESNADVKEEIGSLCDKIIGHSSMLVAHFDDSPEPHTNNDARYVLHAWVCLARAYTSRYEHVDGDIDLLKYGVDYTTRILGYVERNPGQVNYVAPLIPYYKNFVESSQKHLVPKKTKKRNRRRRR